MRARCVASEIEHLHGPEPSQHAECRQEEVEQREDVGREVACDKREQTGERESSRAVQQRLGRFQPVEEIHPHACAPDEAQSCEYVAQILERGRSGMQLDEVTEACERHEDHRSPDEDPPCPLRKLRLPCSSEQNDDDADANEVRGDGGDARVCGEMQVIEVVLIPKPRQADAEEREGERGEDIEAKRERMPFGCPASQNRPFNT